MKTVGSLYLDTITVINTMDDKEKEVSNSENENCEKVVEADNDDSPKTITDDAPKTRHKRSIMNTPCRSNVDCNEDMVEEFV